MRIMSGKNTLTRYTKLRRKKREMSCFLFSGKRKRSGIQSMSFISQWNGYCKPFWTPRAAQFLPRILDAFRRQILVRTRFAALIPAFRDGRRRRKQQFLSFPKLSQHYKFRKMHSHCTKHYFFLSFLHVQTIN